MDNYIQCNSCTLWRWCSNEYFDQITGPGSALNWFCSLHPDLVDCTSKKRRKDRTEKRPEPSSKTVASWFEMSTKYLYMFARINEILDYKFSSWSPFLDVSISNNLLHYIHSKNNNVCPHNDGKWKFFLLLSKWLLMHEHWMLALSIPHPDFD